MLFFINSIIKQQLPKQSAPLVEELSLKSLLFLPSTGSVTKLHHNLKFKTTVFTT